MSTLFIGLGGVGCGTLETLYTRMNDYNRHLQANRKRLVSADYVYIDTDNSIQRKHPEAFQTRTHKTWLPLSVKSPDELRAGFRNMDDNSCEEWYDAGDNPYALTMGADAKRQFSRLAFKEKYTNIRTTLYPHIQNVKNSNGRVYVITGSCGGTGCGIYADVLYTIAELFSSLRVDEVAADVRLIMAMPEGYLDKDDETQNVKKHQGLLNAFATLTELDAICKQKGNLKFNKCFLGNNLKMTGGFRPFHFGYLYDSAGLSRDEVCQRVSDYLFEIELSGDNQNIVAQDNQYNGSDFDLQLTNEINAKWDRTINDEYVKAFCSLGQFSIEKPDDLYRQYFENRLLYDIISKGLIGIPDGVKAETVQQLENDLTQSVTKEVNQWVSGILDSITENDFSDETKFNDAFSVFTTCPKNTIDFVKDILEKRNNCLKAVENLVYSKCIEWLKKYDFTTVYSVLDKVDKNYYVSVETEFNSLRDKISQAKLASLGKYSNKPKSNKALKQFNNLLNQWLLIRVKKALSSGPSEDIKEKDKGYLDICKDFITLSQSSFVITDIEKWKSNFKKKVGALKNKRDRIYIPDLSTITDENNEIIEAGSMVITYNQILKKDGESANLTIGTCTPRLLHEKVMQDIENDVQLTRIMNLNDLFNPDTLLTANSMRQRDKAKAFFGKYKEILKAEIDELIRNNQKVQNLFSQNIVTRLLGLDPPERDRICDDYRNYVETQFNAISLGENANQVYTFSYSDFGGNTEIMQQLGILDINGEKPACTANVDDSFFGDKIVKLIIKTGFNIGQYRHFATYKAYASEQMVSGLTHDPFIDKRFLGELDNSGKYTCDVCAALTKISQDAHAAEQAEQFTLAGCNDVEIYKYGLALLYEYFDMLVQKNKIDEELEEGISLTSGTKTLVIKQPKRDPIRRKFKLDSSSAKTIDLSTLASINNMEDLSTWIKYVLSKKECIENEAELYAKALDVFDLELEEGLQNVIGAMMGLGNKPVYDFFTAYLDWYNKD